MAAGGQAAEAEPKAQWVRDLLRGFDWRVAIPLLAVGGLIGTIFYALQFPRAQFWAVLGNAGITAGAAAFAGALLGLLFGIPFAASSKDGQAPLKSGRYKGNTNLEQISDWLTKLLVGAGLVQLGRAPSSFARLAHSLSNSFGGTSSSAAYGLALAIFYAGCGFFYLYLWSRLSLPRRLDAAENFAATADTLSAESPHLNLGRLASIAPEQAGGAESPPQPTQAAEASAAAAGRTALQMRASTVGESFPPVADSLTELGTRIDREVRRILAATGHADLTSVSLPVMLSALERVADVSTGTIDGIRQIARARNLLDQAGGNVDEASLRQIVESGIQILQALQTAPREHHLVLGTDIALYEDDACTKLRVDVIGVILRTVGSDGKTTNDTLFPTTSIDFEVGQEVSWEFGPNYYNDTWYHDPADSTVKKAWDSSIESLGATCWPFDDGRDL